MKKTVLVHTLIQLELKQSTHFLISQLFQQKLLYTLFANIALKQINVLDKTVLWKTAWIQI